MKLIATLVLIVGVALAGGSIYVAQQYFARHEAAMAAKMKNQPDKVHILVAKKKLDYGTVLEGNKHLKFAEFLEGSVPEGAFREWDKFIAGRDGNRPRILQKASAGMPITRDMVSGFGEEGRMSFNLPEGKRAFSIKIDAISGVAGFIVPGDRVDVMLTRRLDGNLESSIVMQNLLVIAVDQKTDTSTNQARVGRTATVEVTVKQAQKLSVAQRIGRLSLTLRGAAEGEAAINAGTVNVDDVLGLQKPEKKRVGTSVRVRKGGQIQDQVTFE